jgi:hypothetical protein
VSEKSAKSANLFAYCEPGTDTGEYIQDDGLPRVWDDTKWLSPKDALEAEIIDKYLVIEELTDDDLGHLKKYCGSFCLCKIPSYFVLDLANSDYFNGREKIEFFNDLEKFKAEFWKAINESVESGEVSLEDIGKKVHY